MTIRCSILSAMTAYSTAAEVPCERPSGSCGGTRFAMLRWMKKSPGSLPKISETSTRLSQQVMIIALGLCALAAASAYCATVSGVRRSCQAR